MNLVLASKSPRRKEILEKAGYDITIKISDVKVIVTCIKEDIVFPLFFVILYLMEREI